MMYEEFIGRLPEDVKRPTFEEYTDYIEPVYTWHPIFDGNFAKDKAAKLYCAGGLGIFDAMRDTGDMAEELNERITAQRRKSFEPLRRLAAARDALKAAQLEFEEAQAAWDAALAEVRTVEQECREFRAAVREDWEV